MKNEHILVIDDEESIRHTFGAFLSREGYRVQTARDYDTAMELLLRHSFDCIITDILLGSRSGVDILREIKARGLAAPVVMITGEPDVDNAAASLRLGAFDYITKPIRKETLLRVTAHALLHKALLDEKSSVEAEKERYQAHLEAIFHSVEDGIITVNNAMEVIEANEASRRICGTSPKSPHWNEDRPECTMRCRKVLREALEKHRSIKEYQIECNHARQPNRVLVLNISPLKGRDGQPMGAVMLMRDITRLSTLERELKERYRFHNIVGRSKKMQDIFTLLEDLRGVDTTVLITGASGTGKELVAKAIHFNGARAHMPFVAVNCSALAENLLESELFGHVRGAFTGALHDKEGRFQMANHGTLFLDEIGDISPGIQLKLLRVLENKEIERVGDPKPLKLDVQVISATNADLRDRVMQGTFREDLYYRIKVVELHLPSLRERRDDIPLLTNHYLSALRARFRKDITSVSPEVERLFMEYPWPGNVRELIHTLEHAFVVCRGDTIGRRDLPPEIRGFDSPGDAPGKTASLDRETILQALQRCGGNKVKAAAALGVSRQTVYRKIREYRIESPGRHM